MNRRILQFTFNLGTGPFGESGVNSMMIAGLRAMVTMQATVGPQRGVAQAKIFGLSMSTMNQLSALTARSMEDRKNAIIIEAGDDNGLSTIFEGQITIGQIDLNGSPDAALNVLAVAGYFEGVKIIAPSSYPGSVDAATVLASLAQQGGYAFENNGVNVMLSTPYFPGTIKAQIEAVCAHVGAYWIIDRGTLAVWPARGSRNIQNMPLISSDTGMIGYPSYSGQGGIVVRTMFNPQLVTGGLVQVQSTIGVANGTWVVAGLEHALSSELPGGPWETSFIGVPENVV